MDIAAKFQERVRGQAHTMLDDRLNSIVMTIRSDLKTQPSRERPFGEGIDDEANSELLKIRDSLFNLLAPQYEAKAARDLESRLDSLLFGGKD